jgi:hypothetical protein
MKVFNLKDFDFEIEDVPLCPICDQPIEYLQLSAIGGFEEDGYQSFCLIHRDCADDGED